MEALNAYYSRVEKMSKEEKSSHMRMDYSDPNQSWPEYLDYVEDWQHSYDEKLFETRKDFIYVVLARHNQIVECGDHTHQFSTTPIPGAIVVATPDAWIDHASCWYKAIVSADSRLVRLDPQASAPRLSIPDSELIKRLTRLRMIVGENSTPDKLDYAAFKEMWWNQEGRASGLSILDGSHTPYVIPPVSLVEEIKDSLPAPEKPLWLTSGNVKPEVIFDALRVSEDHGLHTLLRVREDSRFILETINAIRSRVEPKSEITPQQLIAGINSCPRCRSVDAYAKSGYPGIYYSPPGGGKSTILRSSLMIGLDTDWLVNRVPFRELFAPFMSLHLPIFTNQYHAITNSGERIIGMYSPKHLRTDEYGNPYTPPSEIAKAMIDMGDDLCILYTSEHMSKMVLPLMRAQYVSQLTRKRLMNELEPSVKFPKLVHSPKTVEDLLIKLTAWSQATARQLRSRRQKHERRTHSH